MTVDRGDSERLEQALQLFGEVDEPLSILAKFVTTHQSRHIVEDALPAYVYLYRWSLVLASDRLAQMAAFIQKMSGYTGSSKDAIELAKGISMFDMLKGVDLKGGGK